MIIPSPEEIRRHLAEEVIGEIHQRIEFFDDTLELGARDRSDLIFRYQEPNRQQGTIEVAATDDKELKRWSIVDRIAPELLMPESNTRYEITCYAPLESDGFEQVKDVSAATLIDAPPSAELYTPSHDELIRLAAIVRGAKVVTASGLVGFTRRWLSDQ